MVSWFQVDRHWFMLAVVFYGLALLYSIFLWHGGFRHQNRINYILILCGFCWHTGAMVLRGFSFNRCPVNNLYEATLFVDWTLVAAYLAMGVWDRLRFLGAFASPIILGMGVFALMPDLDAPYGDRPEFINGWTSLHAALILLSYGAFALSSVAAMMYLSQEHDLKAHKLRAVISRLPPIQKLEHTIGTTLLSGFALLTAGLLVGAVYLKRTYGVYYTGDPKILWSGFVWLLYLGLLIMRWPLSRGGRPFAWGALGSFLFVLLTFWGFNLLSGIHQH